MVYEYKTMSDLSLPPSIHNTNTNHAPRGRHVRVERERALEGRHRLLLLAQLEVRVGQVEPHVVQPRLHGQRAVVCGRVYIYRSGWKWNAWLLPTPSRMPTHIISSPLVGLHGLLGVEALEQEVPVNGQGVRVRAALRACRERGRERKGRSINIVRAAYVRAGRIGQASQPAVTRSKTNTGAPHTIAVELVALERVLARLLELARRCVVWFGLVRLMHEQRRDKQRKGNTKHWLPPSPGRTDHEIRYVPSCSYIMPSLK